MGQPGNLQNFCPQIGHFFRIECQLSLHLEKTYPTPATLTLLIAIDSYPTMGSMRANGITKLFDVRSRSSLTHPGASELGE
jgi:hypothetical protein